MPLLKRIRWLSHVSLYAVLKLDDLDCRSWGMIALTIAYFWQLYTLWILVKLHEAVPGRRYNRYVELAQAAFGEAALLLHSF